MPSSYRPQTIAQILARGIVALARNSESPRTDAQLLIGHVISQQREWVMAHGEAFLSKAQMENFEQLVTVRARGVPMAYILGYAGFYGREFAVSDKVLVPRPETEHLVDEALAHIRARVEALLPKQFVTVLDVGVGSGAIGVTIAAEEPQAFVEGTDISMAALKAAEHNAKRFNVAQRCRFLHGDLATPVLERSYDVVVANLPYIPSDDVPRPPQSAGYEPKDALDGGYDGLDHYRRFMPQAKRLVKPGGLVLLEAAPPVMDGLGVLVHETFGGADIVLGEDYGARLRYIRVKAAQR